MEPALEIPERGTAARAFDAEHALSRLQGLSVMDAASAGEELVRLVASSNRSELAPESRLELLGHAHPHVAQTADDLLQPCMQHPLTPGSAEERRAAAAMTLWSALSVGYRIVAERDAARLTPQRRTTAAHAGLVALGRLALSAFHLYRVPPAGLWVAAHGLYDNARREGLASHGGTPQAEAGADIVTAYKQLVLLAAAGPYHLSPHEQRGLYRALAEWARSVWLTEDTPPTQAATAIVPRGRDESPYTDRGGLNGGRAVWTIDLGPLREHLREHLAELDEAGHAAPAGSLNPPMVRRLLRETGAAGAFREFPRVSSGERVQAVMGMSGAHRVLVQTLAPGLLDGDAAGKRARFGSTSKGRGNLLRQDAGSRPLHTALQRGACNPTEPMRPAANPAVARDWLLANISAGGCHLTRDSEPGLAVRVGELILLSDTSGRDNWTLGSVTWMQVGADDRISIGIATLANAPRPAVLAPRDRSAEATPAMLLPAVASAQRPARLVTPTLPWREGMHALLHSAEGETPVLLRQVLDATSHYAVFRYEPSNHRRSIAMDQSP